VGGVLMISGLVDLYFSYRETQRAIVRVERAKAVAAAAHIEQYLKEIEVQVRETTRTASDDPDASQVGPGRLGFRAGSGTALAQKPELDFVRVLRNVPAVAQLSHLDLRKGAAPGLSPRPRRRRKSGGLLQGARLRHGQDRQDLLEPRLSQERRGAV